MFNTSARRCGRCASSAFYPHPDSVALWHVALAALFLPSVTAWVIASWRRRPYLLVGWFFFLGTLVPMLGLEGVGYQGKTGHRRPLRVFAVHRTFHHDCAGAWRNGLSKSTSPRRCCARSAPPCLLALTVGCLSPGWLLARQCDLVVACLAGHRRQFSRRKQSGKGAAEPRGGSEEGHRALSIKRWRFIPADPVSNLNLGIYEQQRGNFSAAIERYQTDAQHHREIPT